MSLPSLPLALRIPMSSNMTQQFRNLSMSGVSSPLLIPTSSTTLHSTILTQPGKPTPHHQTRGLDWEGLSPEVVLGREEELYQSVGNTTPKKGAVSLTVESVMSAKAVEGIIHNTIAPQRLNK